MTARLKKNFLASKLSSSESTLPRTMDAYVLYNRQYKILICRQHHYAIPQSWVSRHFQKHHKETPLETRNRIEKYVAELDLLRPEEIEPPQDMVPVDGLTIYAGYKCLYDGCLELAGTEASMAQHCKVNHKWIKSIGVKWEKQTLQTFFPSPYLK